VEDLSEALWTNLDEVMLKGFPTHRDRLVYNKELVGGFAEYLWTVPDLSGFEGSIAQKYSWLHVAIHGGVKLSNPEEKTLFLVWDLEEGDYYWKSVVVGTDLVIDVDTRFNGRGEPTRTKKLKFEEPSDYVVKDDNAGYEEVLKLAEAIKDKVDSEA
jgi:hypothetical protein